MKKEKIIQTDLENAKLHGSITLANDGFKIPFVDNPNCLYAVFLPIDGKLNCFVRIFDAYQALIVVDEVHSGSFPTDGAVIKIDPTNKSKDEQSFLEFIKEQSKNSGQEGI